MNGKANKTILLVEDEFLIAMMEKKSLENYNYKVIMAQTGEQAIEIILTDPTIDLILMDINLGRGMNGTEAAAQILKHRHLPIVFLSSHTDKEIVELTERITSYGYVVKNSGITVLDASIKMAFKLFDANEKFRKALNERERAEAVLQETLQTSADIVAAIPSGLFIYQFESPDRLILVSANPEAERLTGLRLEQWQGREFNDIWPEAKRRGITDYFLTTMRTGVTFETEDLYYEDKHLSGAFRIRAFTLPESRLAIAFESISERKQAEKHLRESEERFHALFEHAPLGYQSLDSDGKFVEINQAWLETLGYSREEVIGQWFGDFLAPEYIPSFRECFAVFKARGHIHSEFYMLHKNGDRRYIAFDGRVGHHTDGSFKQTHCIIKDETERRRAEEALRESEARYRQLVDISPDLIAVHQQGRMIFINMSGARLLKATSPEQIVGKAITELLPPDRVNISSERVSTLLEVGGQAPVYEQKLRRLDGTDVDVEVTGIAFLYHGEPAVQIIARDITERKRAEETLRENQAMLKQILDTVPQSIFWKDRKSVYLGCNQAFARACGLTSSEQIIGKTDFDLPWSKAQAEAFRADDVQVIHSGIPKQHIIEPLRNAAGDLGWAETSKLPLLNGQQEIRGVLGVYEDITERKQAEETIQKQIKEKEILLKEVHHRIKNNIASIEALLSMQSESVNVPEAVSVLQDAISRVSSIRVLYENLLLSSEYRELSTQFYLDALIDAIFAIFPDTAGIEFTTRIDDFLLDTEQLFVVGIVVNELLTNAMKYAFVGRDSGIVQVTLTQAAQHVTLTVQDNGQGFAKGEPDTLSRGFGFHIIDVLCQQVSGDFTITQENGTKCVFEFDV